MENLGAEDAARLTERLRDYQVANSTYGLFFGVLYAYAQRLNAVFFDEALPPCILSFEPDGDRAGQFQAIDGLVLPNRININPLIVANGLEAAEVLTHEMVHLWEHASGNATVNNYHGLQFHKKMYDIGIVTDTRFGNHVQRRTRFIDWLNEANDDLHLSEFKLPGKGLTDQSDS